MTLQTLLQGEKRARRKKKMKMKMKKEGSNKGRKS